MKTPTHYFTESGERFSKVRCEFYVTRRHLVAASIELIYFGDKVTRKAIAQTVRNNLRIKGSSWLDFVEDRTPVSEEQAEQAKRLAEDLYPEYFKNINVKLNDLDD